MKILRRFKKYYLVSTKPDLDKEILKPEVPNNFLMRGKFEDWQTPRLLLYETIDDALSGGQFLGQNLENLNLYVYRAKGIRYENLLIPSITSVPYKLVLNEFWYCANLQVEKDMEIKVGKKKETLNYHYGPRSTKAELYKWKWHKILKPWEIKKKTL